MTQWTERFRTHPLWQLMQDLGSSIDQAVEREGNDPSTLEGLARLKSVLTYCGKKLAGADSHLLQAGALDSLASQLQSEVQEVRNYVANGSIGHITNANANADSVLAFLAQINVLLTTEDFVGAKEASETYRRGLDRSLSEVAARVSESQTELDELRRRLMLLSDDAAGERTRMAAMSSEFQSQFSKAQDTRSKEYAEERTRLTGIVSEFQSQFSTAQEGRNREYADAQKVRQDHFQNVVADYAQQLSDHAADFAKDKAEYARLHQSQLDELSKQFVDAATGMRDEILGRKAEVEKLVGVIGNLGVTSGYLKTANEARLTTRVWQAVAVVSMVGLIWIAYNTFLPALGPTFSWSGFAGRVFVSLTVGVLAGYAATQADKYQKLERHHRRLALELEAVGPFIAPLPLEKQEQFRLNIGDRSFGHGDSLSLADDANSPATVLDLAKSKEIRAMIVEIIKALKP